MRVPAAPRATHRGGRAVATAPTKHASIRLLRTPLTIAAALVLMPTSADAATQPPASTLVSAPVSPTAPGARVAEPVEAPALPAPASEAAAPEDAGPAVTVPGARPVTGIGTGSDTSSNTGSGVDSDSLPSTEADADTAAAVDDATAPVSDTAGSGTDDGPSAGVLSGLDARDTHGLRVSSYQLSTDGGGVTAPLKLITNGFLLSMLWEGYRWTVGLAATMIGMALQMSWVSSLADAVEPVAVTLQVNVIDRLGLSQVALSLSGLAAGWLIARGRYVSGAGKLISAGVFAGLAATLLAHPVASITGPDGVLASARTLGQATSTIVVTNGQSADPDAAAIQSQTSASLTDVFVRLPHQLLNYGAVIDGTSCENVYDTALKVGPRASDDDGAREAVGACDEKLKKYADDPGWTGVWSALILLPAGLLLVVMAIVLTVVLFLATAVALFCALKLIWDVVMAQAPGERSGFTSSLASLVGALVSVVFFMVVLGVYCVLLDKFMSGDGGRDPVTRFLVVDLLLLVLTIVTITARKRISERGREWAQRANRWAGMKTGKPVQMPRMPQLTSAGATLAAGRAQARRLGTAMPPLPTSGTTAQRLGQRLGQRVAHSKIVRTGVAAATMATGASGLALKATIGAPVYAPRAARAASAAAKARSAAMRSRLQGARAGVGGFAQEYAHNVGVVAGPLTRPLLKAGTVAGRAAGRKAAPVVTAAGLRFGPGASAASSSSSLTTGRKAPVSAPRTPSTVQPTPANVAAGTARLAVRRRQRTEDPAGLHLAGSVIDPRVGVATPTLRVGQRPARTGTSAAVTATDAATGNVTGTVKASARPRASTSKDADVARLYERMRLHAAGRDGSRR